MIELVSGSIAVPVTFDGALCAVLANEHVVRLYDAPPGEGGDVIELDDDHPLLELGRRAWAYYVLTGTVEGFQR